MSDAIRPEHYGGEENPFEPIKIIEHYDLGFCIGNTVKYILRAGKKNDELEDLKKAQWYLNRRIEDIEVQRFMKHANEEEFRVILSKDVNYKPGSSCAVLTKEELDKVKELKRKSLEKENETQGFSSGTTE